MPRFDDELQQKVSENNDDLQRVLEQLRETKEALNAETDKESEAAQRLTKNLEGLQSVYESQLKYQGQLEVAAYDFSAALADQTTKVVGAKTALEKFTDAQDSWASGTSRSAYNASMKVGLGLHQMNKGYAETTLAVQRAEMAVNRSTGSMDSRKFDSLREKLNLTRAGFIEFATVVEKGTQRGFSVAQIEKYTLQLQKLRGAQQGLKDAQTLISGNLTGNMVSKFQNGTAKEKALVLANASREQRDLLGSLNRKGSGGKEQDFTNRTAGVAETVDRASRAFEEKRFDGTSDLSPLLEAAPAIHKIGENMRTMLQFSMTQAALNTRYDETKVSLLKSISASCAAGAMSGGSSLGGESLPVGGTGAGKGAGKAAAKKLAGKAAEGTAKKGLMRSLGGKLISPKGLNVLGWGSLAAEVGGEYLAAGAEPGSGRRVVGKATSALGSIGGYTAAGAAVGAVFGGVGAGPGAAIGAVIGAVANWKEIPQVIGEAVDYFSGAGETAEDSFKRMAQDFSIIAANAFEDINDRLETELKSLALMPEIIRGETAKAMAGFTSFSGSDRNIRTAQTGNRARFDATDKLITQARTEKEAIVGTSILEVAGVKELIDSNKNLNEGQKKTLNAAVDEIDALEKNKQALLDEAEEKRSSGKFVDEELLKKNIEEIDKKKREVGKQNAGLAAQVGDPELIREMELRADAQISQMDAQNLLENTNDPGQDLNQLIENLQNSLSPETARQELGQRRLNQLGSGIAEPGTIDKQLAGESDLRKKENAALERLGGQRRLLASQEDAIRARNQNDAGRTDLTAEDKQSRAEELTSAETKRRKAEADLDSEKTSVEFQQQDRFSGLLNSIVNQGNTTSAYRVAGAQQRLSGVKQQLAGSMGDSQGVQKFANEAVAAVETKQKEEASKEAETLRQLDEQRQQANANPNETNLAALTQLEEEALGYAQRRVELEQEATDARLNAAKAASELEIQRINSQQSGLDSQRGLADYLGASYSTQLGLAKQSVALKRSEVALLEDQLKNVEAVAPNSLEAERLRNEITAKNADIFKESTAVQRNFVDKALGAAYGIGGGSTFNPTATDRDIFGQFSQANNGLLIQEDPLTMAQREQNLGIPAAQRPLMPGGGGQGIADPGLGMNPAVDQDGRPVQAAAGNGLAAVPGGGQRVIGNDVLDISGKIDVSVTLNTDLLQAVISKQITASSKRGAQA